MAEEVKVSKFAKFRKGIAKFFREIRSELKKVVWLTKEQLVHNTITVIVTCVIIGAIIWIADYGLGKLLKLWVG
ncbi:MAG TPA: preprotein translocase subunit SecE [Clostridia bacterium]|nr:preprotein translocase subunit SecE [Clostridia bacterium]